MLPPYALNLFVPLVDLTEEMGPTEFILGSHAWGSDPPHGFGLSSDRTGGEKDLRLVLPAGSVIIADYRTIHRGTRNRSRESRPVAMYIYGRHWWRDAVNYLEGDYGGTQAKATQKEPAAAGGKKNKSKKSREEVMFWSLVNKWQQGIGAELQRRWEEAQREGL